jgi:hypothetical protein
MGPTIDMLHAKSATASLFEVVNTPAGYVEIEISADQGAYRQIF